MPRYIDADVFEQRLEDKNIFFPALYKIELNSTPTADVVPKSEVAKEIFEEVEKVVNYALCVDITDWSAYTELKKKYTEAGNES